MSLSVKLLVCAIQHELDSIYLGADPALALLVAHDVVGVDGVGALHVVDRDQLDPRLVVRFDVRVSGHNGNK